MSARRWPLANYLHLSGPVSMFSSRILLLFHVVPLVLMVGAVQTGCTRRHASMRGIQTTPRVARSAPARPTPDVVKRLDERAARLWERMDKESGTRNSTARASALRGVAASPDADGGHQPSGAPEANAPSAASPDTSSRDSAATRPTSDPEWPRSSADSSMSIVLGIVAAAIVAALAAVALMRRRRSAM